MIRKKEIEDDEKTIFFSKIIFFEKVLDNFIKFPQIFLR
jgi:hypothetical protein